MSAGHVSPAQAVTNRQCLRARGEPATLTAGTAARPRAGRTDRIAVGVSTTFYAAAALAALLTLTVASLPAVRSFRPSREADPGDGGRDSGDGPPASRTRTRS